MGCQCSVIAGRRLDSMSTSGNLSQAVRAMCVYALLGGRGSVRTSVPWAGHIRDAGKTSLSKWASHQARLCTDFRHVQIAQKYMRV